MYHIYQITNKLNGKRYIGYTTKPPIKRFVEHGWNATRGLDQYIYRAIRKDGIENFKLESLCWGEDEEAGLKIAEPLLIEIFKPEYNMTAGGEGVIGRIYTTQSRRNLSNAIKTSAKCIEVRKLLAESRKGVSLKPLTAGWKIAVAEGVRNSPRAKKQRERLRLLSRGIPKEKLTCPHCGMVGGTVICSVGTLIIVN
jgi:group I intron endonuclease